MTLGNVSEFPRSLGNRAPIKMSDTRAVSEVPEHVFALPTPPAVNEWMIYCTYYIYAITASRIIPRLANIIDATLFFRYPIVINISYNKPRVLPCNVFDLRD